MSSDPSVIDIANVEELPVVTEAATTTTTTTTTEKEDPTTTVRSSTRDALSHQSSCVLGVLLSRAQMQWHVEVGTNRI